MELKSVVLMVGFFLLAAVGYKGVSIIRKNDMIIRTNGISTRHVVSDQICWEISFQNKASTMKEAQLKFVEDKEKVLSFLKKCGFSDDEITQDPPKIDEVLKRRVDEVSKKEREERFFKTEGCFTIRTARGEMVQECLSKTAELFEMGVLFYNNVRYFYKDFEKIKIEMLEEATLDSRIKAEHIAESVGSQVLSVHSLNSGVFELASEDSSATTNKTWYEDISREKKIRVVVHGAFFFK